MINSNIYYQISSQELMWAKEDQSKISGKRLELRLMYINNRYPSNADSIFYQNRFQEQDIKSEINRLVVSRDNHLSNAINYALDLSLEEKKVNSFSIAYLAVSSINSFLRILKDDTKYAPAFSVLLKLSQVRFEFTQDLSNILLKKEIDDLNKLCNGL